ncbi:MAG: ABC transporter substrate-binding protein [Microbacterium sp. SCN 70-200]|uniref:ABC transporter substrate-binding protein n=1 Tax=unclassified Microbacterium TaxID=2609290 RepID=UPI000868B54B|nr:MULTISPECIES: ABC transporter substrate-binding protein [unclassified Microbacterium]MBN9213383.1 ABC transporter substrate-binding protein [Microbacterium sp.]ODT40507.1 MAG: ABC transporter substrate-binding protein [Microbacterium sp. SCN 70-200]OJV85023.1 MAG: ABC transporter substrate-binding protein [Microbacterium sp. 70-16]
MSFRPLTALSAVVVAGALVLTGCASGSAGGADATDGASAGGTLTLGSVVNVTSFDPAQAHLGHQMPIYQAVYDTLILREPDGTLAPMLATDWTYNDDNTVLTLDLRTDVTFTDGAVFDAAAAKANLDHFMEANGPDANQAKSIESVAVVDDDTIDITLTAADPAMTYYLSQAAGFMGSPEALGTEEIKTMPVGSGPYVLDASGTVNGSQFTFTVNDDYWNKDAQKFGKVVFKVLSDTTARVNAIVSGQVDGVLLDPTTAAQADNAGLTKTTYPVDWQGLLLFDRDGAIAPELADVRVRQAINYAFDRATMLKELQFDEGEVTAQVFGKTTDAYIPELDDAYAYDPEKAKELLAEAGYADGFSITIPLIADTESIMAMVKQQLADIGITVNLATAPFDTYVADIIAAKFPVAWFSIFQGEPWVAIRQMIATDAAYNPFQTTSAELQADIDAVQTGGDQSGVLAQKVNQYVTDEAWFAPFYRVNQLYYSNDKITLVPQVQQAVPNLYNYSPAS